MSRHLSDQERAALLASAISHLRRAHLQLLAAGCGAGAVQILRASKVVSEAYTLASGRSSPDIRCTHGTLLTRSCAACAAAAEGVTNVAH